MVWKRSSRLAAVAAFVAGAGGVLALGGPTLAHFEAVAPLQGFGAFVLGSLIAVAGGVLGPIVTHLTWSLGMLFALPWALDLWS